MNHSVIRVYHTGKNFVISFVEGSFFLGKWNIHTGESLITCENTIHEKPSKKSSVLFSFAKKKYEIRGIYAIISGINKEMIVIDIEFYFDKSSFCLTKSIRCTFVVMVYIIV